MYRQYIVYTLLLMIYISLPPVSLAKSFSVLALSETKDWRHPSISSAIDALQNLAQDKGFHINFADESSAIADSNFNTHDVIIFLSTSGDILSDQEKEILVRFIRAGKGFVGIHSAAATEESWPWYRRLIGRGFIGHPPIQQAQLKVLAPSFPGLKWQQVQRTWHDEWYVFTAELAYPLHYLLSVNEATYKPYGNWLGKKIMGMGSFHPVAWYQYYQGGRSFYTALGHSSEHYQDAQFISHLYGGIYWAATGNKH